MCSTYIPSIKLAQKTDHFSSISQQPYIHISDAQDIATKGLVPLDITLTWKFFNGIWSFGFVSGLCIDIAIGHWSSGLVQYAG